jgi:predicted nucleic acid-binding protein
MRLVVDTNVVVSAFLWQGTPGRLLEMAGEKQVANNWPLCEFNPSLVPLIL